MNPFISGPPYIAKNVRFYKWRYLRMYEELREIVNCFEERKSSWFIWDWPHRLAKFAKFVVFYVKMFFFIKKFQKVGVHNLAENGRIFQILLQTCFFMSLDPLWCILNHYTIFMNFDDEVNLGQKIKILAKAFFFLIFFEN